MHRFVNLTRTPWLDNTLVLALLALATLFNAKLAGADSTFVWKDCSPNCGSGSWANPYQTIQAAVNAVGGPGAIIVVRPATTSYKEVVTISASGRA